MAPQRQQLGRLSRRVATVEKDLGGAMTYRAQRSSTTMQIMMDSLQEAWRTLRRLTCSPFHKEQLAVLQLWPRLVYGAGILHVTAAQFQRLRATVVRAYGHGKAGANPSVRLGCLRYTDYLTQKLFGDGDCS